MIEIALLLITAVSGGYAVLLVSRKVPLLLQVPQQLIEESFVTRPSRLKHALEAVVAFVREKRYYDAFSSVALAFLGWARLRLLRFERTVFHLASISEAWSHAKSGGQQRYWDELKKDRMGAEKVLPEIKEERTVTTVVAAVMPPEQTVPPEQKHAAKHSMDGVSLLRETARAKSKPRSSGNSIPLRKGTRGGAPAAAADTSQR